MAWNCSGSGSHSTCRERYVEKVERDAANAALRGTPPPPKSRVFR